MPDLHGLMLFLIAGLLLNLTPGVDLLYILGQAGARGLRAGVVATAGVCAGCSVHIAAATLGMSALLATSTTAFTVLKIIGAVYLLYLGVSLWLPTLRRTPSSNSEAALDARGDRPVRASGNSSAEACATPRPATSATPGAATSAKPGAATPLKPTSVAGAGRIFVGGFLTNALNPKVALFFLAFLPQFIAPGSAAKSQVMVLLGLLFVVNSFVVNVVLAWAATRLARRLGARPGVGRWLQRLTGTLFLYFGLRLLGSRLPG